MSIGETIRRRREELGMSQLVLAKAVGVSQPTIRKVEGATRRSRYLPAIAKVLKLKLSALDPDYEGQEDLVRVPPGQEFPPDPEFDADGEQGLLQRRAAGLLRPGELIERNVTGAMGAGSEVVHIQSGDRASEGAVATWTFPPRYLHAELRSSEENSDIIAVDGDSMLPTLLPGDRVMVNRAQNVVNPDGLYAIYTGVGVAVKRLEIVLGSSPLRIKIISDNKQHTSYELAHDELTVIGRVVCRITRC